MTKRETFIAGVSREQHALLWEARRAVLTDGAPLVSLDPGTGSTGWCVRFPEETITGQAPAEDALAQVEAVLEYGYRGRIGLLAIEQPANIRMGRQWMLAWTGGMLRGSLRRWMLDDGFFWWPVPQTWRAILGHPGGRGSRAAATQAALHTARKHGIGCSSVAGTDLVDEAMAFCIGLAAVRMLRRVQEVP